MWEQTFQFAAEHLGPIGVGILVLAALAACVWWAHRRLSDHQKGCEKGTEELKASIEEARRESKEGDDMLLDRIDTLALEMRGSLNEGSTLFRKIEGMLARLDERTRND